MFKLFNCALELEINVRELFSMKSRSFVTLFLDFENWKLFDQKRCDLFLLKMLLTPWVRILTTICALRT